MTKLAASLWKRATEALEAARHVLSVSADAAASRAYYAAFYAVSALFALQGRRFRKHSALEAAVHHDLVRPGTWPVELGQQFSDLVAARKAGGLRGRRTRLERGGRAKHSRGGGHSARRGPGPS